MNVEHWLEQLEASRIRAALIHQVGNPDDLNERVSLAETQAKIRVIKHYVRSEGVPVEERPEDTISWGAPQLSFTQKRLLMAMAERVESRVEQNKPRHSFGLYTGEGKMVMQTSETDMVETSLADIDDLARQGLLHREPGRGHGLVDVTPAGMRLYRSLKDTHEPS